LFYISKLPPSHSIHAWVSAFNLHIIWCNPYHFCTVLHFAGD